MAETLKRSMSSREMMVKASKEVAKSVVVAKTVQVGAQRLGLGALASSVGVAAWAGGLALARKVHPEYLDPVSANQINRDKEFVMNCHIWLSTRDPLKIEEVHETMEWYVKNFSRFRERAVVRDWLWPYWESMPQSFDMTNHIVLDATEKNHETMQDYISASLTQGMNPLHPLWKLIIFTNFTFEDGSRGQAILFKYHHCMGDGFSLARTIFSLDTENALEPPKQANPTSAGGHKPGDISKVVSKFAGAATKLLGMKDDPASSLKAAKLLKPLDNRIACTLTSRAPITDIKKAAKARGFTINDMVLGALASSLREYQLEKGVPLVDPLAGVWVALRPLSEAFSARDLSAPLEEPGNKSLGCVYVRLPVMKEYPSKIDRVQAVADEISQLKGSPEPLLAQQFMSMFGLMPTKITNPIWDLLANKITLSVSNLPGPPKGWKFCGIEPSSFSVFVPPVGTISTFALITSFDDRITLSLAMDGTIFNKEDAGVLTRHFDNELIQLAATNPPSRL